MNRLIATLLAIIATVSVPSTSALLFSPLLLRANNNPFGIAQRRSSINASSPSLSRSTTTIQVPSQIISPEEDEVRSSVRADFSHDDDLMRYKHELLGYVYEKSLNRGFASDDQ